MQYITQLVAKISVILAILCAGSLFAMEKMNGQVSQMTHPLIDEEFIPAPELLDLLHRVGMPQELTAISEINRWSQTNLLRQGERWHQQTDKYESLRDELFPLFEKLGFIHEAHPVPYMMYKPDELQPQIYPHYNYYRGAIVHGATLGRVRLRLHHLVELWRNNVRFHDIYFLTGDRTLDVERENVSYLLSPAADCPLKIRSDWHAPVNLPANETEMVKFVWEQSAIPTEMRNSVNVHFVSAPKKLDPKTGNMVRPTTDDTADCFFSIAKPGRYIAVSNQPYVTRQDMAVRVRMPEGFVLETVGRGLSNRETIIIILDELARLIYQVNKLAEKK